MRRENVLRCYLLCRTHDRDVAQLVGEQLRAVIGGSGTGVATPGRFRCQIYCFLRRFAWTRTACQIRFGAVRRVIKDDNLSRGRRCLRGLWRERRGCHLLRQRIHCRVTARSGGNITTRWMNGPIDLRMFIAPGRQYLLLVVNSRAGWRVLSGKSRYRGCRRRLWMLDSRSEELSRTTKDVGLGRALCYPLLLRRTRTRYRLPRS